MTGQCSCLRGGRPSSRLARQFSKFTASILPGAMLVLLPKCPLCIAAWLTVATGIGVSAEVAACVPGILVAFWIAALALAAAPIVRRRLSQRVSN